MEVATERQEYRAAMASKNPKTPTPARAKSPARPTAPRRRATPKAIVPAEVVAEERPAAQVPIQTAPEASTAAAPTASIDYVEHVRTRAYFLSLTRQGRPANPVEDWLAAERELGSGDERNA